MNILGIHHIALRCNGEAEFHKAISFYTELLGLPLVRNWDSNGVKGAMVDTGAGMLEIFSNGHGGINEVFPHLAFHTDDTDVCIAQVREAGYEITMEPTDIVIASTPPYPARIAFCRGPAGEEVEFFCEK